MKNCFLTIALLFCFSAGFAQKSADEKEVLQLNEAYDEAIKNADVAFYEKLLAEDFISYGPNGTVKDRNQVLEEVKKQKSQPTYRMSKLSSEDVKVKLSGDLAVVTAKYDSTIHSLEDDEPHDDTGHYMAVYQKKDGRWRLLSEMGNEKYHTPEELEPSLIKASNKYDQAIKSRDRETFKKLLAEDYTSTNPEGKVRTKEEDIAMMFDPELELESISTGDKKFKIYRNFAVETGQYEVTGNYKGEKFTEKGRYTSTWKYEDGKWKLLADHTSATQPEK